MQNSQEPRGTASLSTTKDKPIQEGSRIPLGFKMLLAQTQSSNQFKLKDSSSAQPDSVEEKIIRAVFSTCSAVPFACTVQTRPCLCTHGILFIFLCLHFQVSFWKMLTSWEQRV